MSEPHDIRVKRLYMRSIRRGIKEMDLILQSFASAELAGMDAAQLDLYEAFLDEPDLDLYQWVSGQSEVPDHFAGLVAQMRDGRHGMIAR